MGRSQDGSRGGLRGGSRRVGWTLRQALAAQERGFYLFPVRPGEKLPAHRGWQAEATLDPAQIRRWFRAGPSGSPTYNIGVSTGPSQLLVIDLDPAHGTTAPPEWDGARDGRDVLGRLAAAAGEPVPLDTFAVSTPSGGRHLYYRRPAGVALGNTIGSVGWRVDSRGIGGFVLGAGSSRADGGYYRLINDTAVAPLPGWLTTLLTPSVPEPRRGEPAEGIAHLDNYVAAVVRAECQAVGDAPVGRRHTTLLRASRILGELVEIGGLTVEEARSHLHAASAGHTGVERWSPTEADTTITDGIAYGRARPLYQRRPIQRRTTPRPWSTT